MRITNVVLKIHNGWLTKLKWKIQSKKTVLDTGIEEALKSKGLNVRNAADVVRVRQKPEFMPMRWEREIKKRYKYLDQNVLVYGVKQAQVLTKTLAFDALPERVERKFNNFTVPADVERSMHQSVLVSHLLDGEQVKSKEKITIKPDKPRHFLPPEYGISPKRKNFLLATRMLNHCDRLFGRTEALSKKTIHDAFFTAHIRKNNDEVSFRLTAETFLSSKKPIQGFDVQISAEHTIPSIYPLDQTISIPEIDSTRDPTLTIYPIRTDNMYAHPHTILLHYSKFDVVNLFEEPVTDDQFESRGLIKAFAVAASRAMNLFGSSVKDLQAPIVVQVVQLDGQRIQFGIFQLNTLDLDNEKEIQNYWFRQPIMNVYDECIYRNGRPSLTNYNFNVFKMMSVFYSNN